MASEHFNLKDDFFNEYEILKLIFKFFNESEDIIFIFKLKNKVEELIYANESFFRNLNYSKDDLTKIKFKDLFVNFSRSEKNKVINQLLKNKSASTSALLLSKNGFMMPVNIKVYLYKKKDDAYVISIAKDQIEKNIIEFRKYISEFLLKNFQKNQIEEDLIAKVAQSIFVFFNINTLLYFPVDLKDEKIELYYMKESSLVKTSKEEIIEPLKEVIENNFYLLKVKKDPIFIHNRKNNIEKIVNKKNYNKIEELYFTTDINNIVLIPIYLEDELKAIIYISSEREDIFADEINLIRFTFQGLIIFKMKEIYFKQLQYQKNCFSDLLNYSLEMHYREHFPTRKLEYISSACRQITGFTEEELSKDIGLFWERIHPEDRKKLIEPHILNKNIIINSTNYYEYRFYHKDGTIRWFSDLFTIIFDEKKKPLYIVGSIRDITKQKENEQFLASMQMQIAQAQKMEAIGRFSSEISHDFSNILSGLKSNMQLSKEILEEVIDDISEEKDKIQINDKIKGIIKDKTYDKLYELKDNIEDCSLIIKKGLELTEKIKQFSQKKHSKTSTFEVNEAILSNQIIFNYSKKKNIEIKYQLADEKLYVNMNKTQFDQIILNLVINAYDSIDSKGYILIKTEKVLRQIDNKKSEKINNDNISKNKMEYVKLTIEDTGCGIDPGILDRIFEPFFTTKGEKGTGLGLSIVYNIIKQNNGIIEVNSEVGRGTSFYIYLPLIKIK